MSTPAPPRHPGVLHATQQQLDELDALIQRMLTLPVNQADDDPFADLPPVPPPLGPDEREELAEVPALAPRVSAIVRPPEVSMPERPPEFLLMKAPQPEPHPQLSSPEVSAPLPSFSVESPPVANIELPEANHRGEERSNERAIATPARPIGERQALLANLAWWHRPLVHVNRGFDRLTVPFGPAGCWLRGERGRAVLGWTGLVFLAAALAWGFLDWVRWNW